MKSMHHTHLLVTDRTAAEGGYRVVVSARNDEGMPELDLAQLNTDRYLANPVVLWQHDQYEGLPIGRTTRLEMASEGLVAEFEFLPGDYAKAERIKNAWDRGFLGAASVGWKYEDGGTPTLVEWSLVSVPRDPEALRASHGAMLEHLHRGDESYLRGVLDTVILARSQVPSNEPQVASASRGPVHYQRPNIMSLIAQRDSVTQRS